MVIKFYSSNDSFFDRRLHVNCTQNRLARNLVSAKAKMPYIARTFILCTFFSWRTHFSGAAQLSILSQLPQFFFIMMGEVLLSIAGLQFAFEQAPPAMKSVLTAAWFCNNAFGNLIIVAVTEWQPFKLQSNEYFFMRRSCSLQCWCSVGYPETIDTRTMTISMRVKPRSNHFWINQHKIAISIDRRMD